MNSHKFPSRFAPKSSSRTPIEKNTLKNERLQPDNCLFVDGFPFLRGHFWVPAVSFRVWILKFVAFEMGVSKNRGAPKWMVKIMETPIKMDDLGVPLFSETPKSSSRTLDFHVFDIADAGSSNCRQLGSWREKNMEDLFGFITTKKKMATPTRMRLETLKGMRLNFSKTRESRKG